MKLFTGDTKAALSKAAEAVSELAAAKPECVLALSASPALDGVYKALLASGTDFTRCTVFLTEEYADVPEAASRYTSLRAAFLGPAGVAHIHRPSAEGYDGEIDASGGIDLALLAIGGDGHIAFCEPLAAFDSDTHVTKLIESTTREECPGLNPAPVRGITMGIRTLMRARRVVLFAAGADRADAVERTVAGRAHISMPSTLMQLHLDAVVCTDRAAAGNL